MGGSLFKNKTERIKKNNYLKLQNEILTHLKQIWNTNFHISPSYRLKETFGDMDVLILNNGTLGNIKEVVQNYFSTDVFVNGNVYSFVYNKFQIDLILQKSKNWEISKIWFSYDPCSNLMGKTAHSFNCEIEM